MFISENWRRFKQEVQRYLIAAGLENKSEEQKIALLLHVAKSLTVGVYNTFEKYDNPKKNRNI